MRTLIRYRELRKEDIRQVQEVALKAWNFAYREIYAPSTIRRQVAEYYATRKLKAELQRVRNNKSFFQVALDDRKLVGYANGGRTRGSWRNPFRPNGKVYHVTGWELFRIYLLPEYIGRDIGRALLIRWEAFLREKKAKSYFVTYHVKNKLAKEFYLRNGLVRVKKFDHGPTSPCLVKKL